MATGAHSARYASFPSRPNQTSSSLRPFFDINTSTLETLRDFSALLKSSSHSFQVFDLIRCHQHIWVSLPENGKNGEDHEYRDAWLDVTNSVKARCSNIVELLPMNEGRPALLNARANSFLTHHELKRFIQNFNLGLANPGSGKPKVVVALPNGPLLALACLAVSTYYTLVPISTSSGPDQFQKDVKQVEANAILITEHEMAKLQLHTWVKQSDIALFIARPENDLTFSLSLKQTSSCVRQAPVAPNTADDFALLLFTSGTSGTKKLVPISTYTLLAGVAFVIESWQLTNNDRCLNMMPLNHVGGIVRNLFAPVMAGGSTICCASFDPNLFWDLVEGSGPTWYYASPSMHSTILIEGENRTSALTNSSIRLVCNAAGALLPTLASQLQTTFGCTVLPSYGMTECMPIATPPVTYRLDRPGTSGVAVGPELSIRDSANKALPPGTTGTICVRGAPTFPGYLNSNHIDRSVFASDGWFDTGDMGYMDKDGYLYINGRSKEVINRGGEIISPFEVEDAIVSAARNPTSTIFGRVTEAMAFSVPHDVLQEVVGIVIVTSSGKARPDLRQLQEAIRTTLDQPKWPVVVVYMDGVPKAKNKLLRIRFAERIGLDTISDVVPAADRHFEAECPPPETLLTVKIFKWTFQVDYRFVEYSIRSELGSKADIFVRRNASDGLPQAFIFQSSLTRTANARDLARDLEVRLRERIDGFLIPSSIKFLSSPKPTLPDGSVDEDALKEILFTQTEARNVSSVQKKVQEIFASVLACSSNDIDEETDFFAAGGDSLRAGRLLSMLRKELDVRLSTEDLFTNGTVRGISELIEERIGEPSRSTTPPTGELPGCTKTHSSTNPILLLVQLFPIAGAYPLRLGLQWTFFLFIMAETANSFPYNMTVIGRLVHLILSMMASRFAIQLIAPLVAIMFKWIVIGRYKEGLYPMWGLYHTRWWLTQKVLQVCGKGIFNSCNWSRKLFFRSLGVKIGDNVTIHEKASLGEYDLIEIGHNVKLDRCTCRPFAAERNTSMLLKRIKIGSACTVGLKAIIAPGATLTPNTCVGPNSSSWEMEDANEGNRDLLSSAVPQPHLALQLLVIEPVALLVKLVARIPWVLGISGIALHPPARVPDMVQEIAIWYTTSTRLSFHFLARVLDAVGGPIALFAMILVIQKIMNVICGKLVPGTPGTRSQRQKLRMALLARIVPDGDLSKVAELFGSHYEFVSILVRALGGRVGKRVYWPGVGPSIQDFELVDVGNDVVFGSRAHLITSDGYGSEPIKIGDGAMIADRVVVLPGTRIGEGVVLGSGALTRRNCYYPENTVWVGSKAGSAICLTGAGQGQAKTSMTSTQDTRAIKPEQISVPVEALIEKGVGVSPRSLESGSSIFYNGSDIKTRKFFGDDRNYKTDEPVKKTSARTPFGRAFYEGTASYYVMGMGDIFCYSAFTTASVAVYWNLATVIGVKFVAILLQTNLPAFQRIWWRFFTVYGVMSGTICVMGLIQTILALAIVVAAKWILLGRRQPGEYDWDKSSYCQRWQIFLTIERIRRRCYSGRGIIGLLTGTHYAVMYFRALGAKIGKDCSLFANGRPTLMFTEPDLLTLGDRVTVDDASLVGHINSRGNFKLHKLFVGSRSVLRTGSRLLAGANMGEDTCLLEHTLVMSGDYVDDGMAYQGWPGGPTKVKRA